MSDGSVRVMAFFSNTDLADAVSTCTSLVDSKDACCFGPRRVLRDDYRFLRNAPRINAFHQRSEAAVLPGLSITGCSKPFAVRVSSFQVRHGTDSLRRAEHSLLETGSRRVNLLLLALSDPSLTFPGWTFRWIGQNSRWMIGDLAQA
jgi:hypothetical protein